MTAPSPSPTRALVLGGGLAGIAAAVRLADEGRRVTLIETRPRLGGRATSFTDPRTGETLDNCQHVTLGCCTAYLALLERLGAGGLIEWHDEQYWIEPGGRETVIRPGRLPPPMHFAGSFLRARFLSWRDKAAVARAMPAIRAADRARWSERPFTDFLGEHRQTPGAIERFWRPVVVSACNLQPERVAASAALQVFQDGFLAGAEAARIGVPRVPLVRLYDGAERLITESGGEVRLGASVTSFDARSATLASGERLAADLVVCALPFERALKAADPELQAQDPRFEQIARLTHSPIVGVHLGFERPVLHRPHAVLVGCATHWLFRKDAEGRRVHAVISAADDWVGLTEDAIVERVLADLHACLPGAGGERPTAWRAVKERRATFAAAPGSDAARPDQGWNTWAEQGRPVLVGDYTRTGWPATMEGAVRSVTGNGDAGGESTERASAAVLACSLRG